MTVYYIRYDRNVDHLGFSFFYIHSVPGLYSCKNVLRSSFRRRFRSCCYRSRIRSSSSAPVDVKNNRPHASHLFFKVIPRYKNIYIFLSQNKVIFFIPPLRAGLSFPIRSLFLVDSAAFVVIVNTLINNKSQ